MTDRLFDLDHIPNANSQRRSRQRNGLRYGPADNDIRCTPDDLFNALHLEFGFTLDVAASHDNAKCSRYFTEDDDGLRQPWVPERCWMNPPYSQCEWWTEKAAREARAGALVVALLPVRSDLHWFHRHVMGEDAEVRFIRGRVRFTRPWDASWRGSAPHASMIVIWGTY